MRNQTNNISGMEHDSIPIIRNRYKTIRITIKNKTKKTLYIPLFKKDNVNDINDYNIECNQIVLCNEAIIGKIDYDKMVCDFIINTPKIEIISILNKRRHSFKQINSVGHMKEWNVKNLKNKPILYNFITDSFVVKINPKESFDIDLKIYTFTSLKITEI